MTAKQICLSSIVWMLAVTAVVFFPNISPLIATPIVLIGIIFVVGLLWAINLKIQPEKIAEFMLYAIGLGLGFVMFGGLLINWLLPYFGILQPLAKLPLIIFFDVSTLVLSLCAYFSNKAFRLPWKLSWPNKTSLFFGIAPILFLILSICGAEILNNGGKGTLTLIMLFGIALYVVALIIMRRSVGGWVYISALYFISLSLLLMYALRSSHIFGWDINLEYQVFQMTLQNLRWKMSYYPGLDYNACVSITILPTIFKELTNISSEYVFKVTFQLLFAIVPVMTYVLAKRYLKETLAFLAAFLLASQTWFFEQMPALIRQETAFLFYAAILLVLFDDQLTVRTRYILFSIFTAALIISHYSTSYVWVALLCVVLILSYVSRFFIRSLNDRPTVIKPMMLVVSLILLCIWQVFITGTVAQATNFITNHNTQTILIATSSIPIASAHSDTVSAATISGETAAAVVTPIALPSVGISTVIKNAFMTALFSSGNANTNQNILAAEQKAIHQYTNQVGYEQYTDVANSGYIPMAINDNISVLPKLPSLLSILIDFLAKLSKFLLIDIFPVIGIIGMYFLLRHRSSKENYDFIIFNVGAYGLIVLMIFIPYLQEYYNFTRLYLQMFLGLSTLAVYGGVLAAKYLPRYRTLALALMVVVVFCSLNGAFDQLTGGQARLTLDQPPSTLDAPYIYDTEIAGAQWFAQNRNPALPVQADIVAGLRLQSFANISAFNFAIFPQTLERNSYVYLINANIAQGSAFYQSDNNLLVYNYPLAFLNANKNLIYNNGGSRVYR